MSLAAMPALSSADEMEAGVRRDTGLTRLCWGRAADGRIGTGKGRWNGNPAVTALHAEASSFPPAILLSPTEAVDPKDSKPLGSLRAAPVEFLGNL